MFFLKRFFYFKFPSFLRYEPLCYLLYGMMFEKWEKQTSFQKYIKAECPRIFELHNAKVGCYFHINRSFFLNHWKYCLTNLIFIKIYEVILNRLWSIQLLVWNISKSCIYHWENFRFEHDSYVFNIRTS